MENYGYFNPRTGLNSRISDFLKCLDTAIDYAIENRVEAVLFAGDAYKSREPSQTTQKAFAKRVYRLSKNNIPFVGIIGNHDSPNTPSKAHTLEIFTILKTPSVYISGEAEVLTINLKNNKKLQIATLPWFTADTLLTKEEQKDKNMEEINTLLLEKVKKIVNNLKSQINPKIPSVLMAHNAVSGAEFGSEQKVMISQDFVIPLNILASGPWFYVALGHLHKFQVLEKNPPVVYSGSIDRVDFGEEKEDKGFIFTSHKYDVQGTKKDQDTRFKFIKVPARRFVSISINITPGEQNLLKKIKEEIKNNRIEHAVVKIKISGPKDNLDQISERQVLEYLKKAYFISAIEKEVLEKRRIKKGMDYEKELNPIEALKEYFRIKKVEKRKSRVLQEKARELMKEVEQR